MRQGPLVLLSTILSSDGVAVVLVNLSPRKLIESYLIFPNGLIDRGRNRRFGPGE